MSLSDSGSALEPRVLRLEGSDIGRAVGGFELSSSAECAMDDFRGWRLEGLGMDRADGDFDFSSPAECAMVIFAETTQKVPELQFLNQMFGVSPHRQLQQLAQVYLPQAGWMRQCHLGFHSCPARLNWLQRGSFPVSQATVVIRWFLRDI